jgi:heme exporter protein C
VAILALVGVVNIPIIKYSVDWFTTLHQPASITFTNEPTIETSMLWPLLVNTIGLYIFIAGVILAAMRVEVLKREQATEWVRDIMRSMQR